MRPEGATSTSPGQTSREFRGYGNRRIVIVNQRKHIFHQIQYHVTVKTPNIPPENSVFYDVPSDSQCILLLCQPATGSPKTHHNRPATQNFHILAILFLSIGCYFV